MREWNRECLTSKKKKAMFEIPKNNCTDLRDTVVYLICKAFYHKKEMYWCDTSVSVDGTFRSKFDSPDGRKSYRYTEAERDAAFERFRKQGWHILRRDWCTPKGDRLYCFVLRETRQIENNGRYLL